MRIWVRALGLLSGLRILCCHELWYSSKTWFSSCIVVAVAGSYNSDSMPSLETSICHRVALKSKRKKKGKCEFLPGLVSEKFSLYSFN